MNSSGRSRPPIEARARGSPARIQLGRTQSGRLDPESSSYSCLAEDTIAGLNRRAFPVEPFDLFGRAISQIARYIPLNDLSALATISGLVETATVSRNFTSTFSLCIFDRSSYANGACLASSSCVYPSFGRNNSRSNVT